ncbi:PiggyBac transposable element-derived protein 4 [Anthophora retusa]
MLSTMHNLEFSDSGKQNYKTKEKIVKPTVVLDYNKNMGGVDGGDQLLSKFHTMRRYHKVYKKEFFLLSRHDSFEQLYCLQNNL